MALLDSVLTRLEGQLAALATVSAAGAPGLAEARPEPLEWSAREHVAHLARHATVFLERIRRIGDEDRPALGRYRAEEDAGWEAWQGLSWAEARARLAEAQARLLAWARALGDDETRRTAIHPDFGEMPVACWLDFFLLHQAHHLYLAMVALARARRRDPVEASPITRPGGEP